MCGLFGIIRTSGVGESRPDALASAVAIELEFAAARRGLDSWGYVTAGAEDAMSIARGLGCIVPISGRRRTPLAPIVLGHTRHATHGEVTIENSHPFTNGDVTLMHNGIIYNAPPKYKVDSMILAERVSERESISTLRGYGTVAWLEGGTPYVCRMRGGDLDVAWVSSLTYQTRFFIYASDLDESIKYLQTEFVDLTIRRHPDLPAGRVYRVDVDTLTLRRENYELNLEHNVMRRWQDYGMSGVSTSKTTLSPSPYGALSYYKKLESTTAGDGWPTIWKLGQE